MLNINIISIYDSVDQCVLTRDQQNTVSGTAKKLE